MSTGTYKDKEKRQMEQGKERNLTKYMYSLTHRLQKTKPGMLLWSLRLGPRQLQPTCWIQVRPHSFIFLLCTASSSHDRKPSVKSITACSCLTAALRPHYGCPLGPGQMSRICLNWRTLMAVLPLSTCILCILNKFAYSSLIYKPSFDSCMLTCYEMYLFEYTVWLIQSKSVQFTLSTPGRSASRASLKRRNCKNESYRIAKGNLSSCFRSNIVSNKTRCRLYWMRTCCVNKSQQI